MLHIKGFFNLISHFLYLSADWKDPTSLCFPGLTLVALSAASVPFLLFSSVWSSYVNLNLPLILYLSAWHLNESFGLCQNLNAIHQANQIRHLNQTHQTKSTYPHHKLGQYIFSIIVKFYIHFQKHSSGIHLSYKPSMNSALTCHFKISKEYWALCRSHLLAVWQSGN